MQPTRVLESPILSAVNDVSMLVSYFYLALVCLNVHECIFTYLPPSHVNDHILSLIKIMSLLHRMENPRWIFSQNSIVTTTLTLARLEAF